MDGKTSAYNDMPSTMKSAETLLVAQANVFTQRINRFEELLARFSDAKKRVDGIANRLNSTDFYKNRPEKEGMCGEPCDPRTPLPDGFLGVLTENNNRFADRLQDLDKTYLDDLEKTLSYIETQI